MFVRFLECVVCLLRFYESQLFEMWDPMSGELSAHWVTVCWARIWGFMISLQSLTIVLGFDESLGFGILVWGLFSVWSMGP